MKSKVIKELISRQKLAGESSLYCFSF